eukprot:1696263-Pleurochrysis_carterae.AAC.1
MQDCRGIKFALAAFLAGPETRWYGSFLVLSTLVLEQYGHCALPLNLTTLTVIANTVPKQQAEPER